MQHKTKNDITLNNYFKNDNFIEYKKIRDVARDTGCSISTISRFAKRKGFSNYYELSQSFFKKKINELGKRFINFLDTVINEKKDVCILTSSFTKSVGYFVYEKLKELKLNVSFNEKNISEIDQNTFLIFICSSGQFVSFETFEKSNLKNKAILITLKKPKFNVSKTELLWLGKPFTFDRADEIQLIQKIFNFVADGLIYAYKNNNIPRPKI